MGRRRARYFIRYAGGCWEVVDRYTWNTVLRRCERRADARCMMRALTGTL